jgi:hypothetical protein
MDKKLKEIAEEEWSSSGVRCKKDLVIDPDSKLPIGTIIRNAKGQYAIVDYKAVVLISEEKAAELLKGLQN